MASKRERRLETEAESAPEPLRLERAGADWAIADLPGLDAGDRDRLQDCGIDTTLALLRRAANPRDREALADRLRVPRQRVAKWTALADLARLPAVGVQHCGALLHAGIASPGQLAQQPAHRVHQQLQRFYVAALQRRDLCPPPGEVTRWIGQARRFASP